MNDAYTFSDPFGLRSIWDALLDLYSNFSAFCSKYGLRHYVAFGTALGAVRHKGFIPWDDDMDVYMPRPDYERFFELIKQGDSLCLNAVNMWTDSLYKLQFGKVYNKELLKVPQIESKDGVFIDVFPLDGLPSGNLRFKLWMIERGLKRRLSTYLHSERLSDVISKSLDKWGKKWLYDESYFVQCHQENLSKIKDRLYTRGMFGVAKWIPFDRIQIAVPENVEDYLYVEFGDYMKLPPESQRRPSHNRFQID